MTSKWRRRTDTTHREVMDTLRQCGWLVIETHKLPLFVDGVAFKPSTQRFWLIEAKSKGGKPTESQEKLIARGWPVALLESADEAAQLR